MPSLTSRAGIWLVIGLVSAAMVLAAHNWAWVVLPVFGLWDLTDLDPPLLTASDAVALLSLLAVRWPPVVNRAVLLEERGDRSEGRGVRVLTVLKGTRCAGGTSEGSCRSGAELPRCRKATALGQWPRAANASVAASGGTCFEGVRLRGGSS